jgi:2-aminoadipate transaminase
MDPQSMGRGWPPLPLFLPFGGGGDTVKPAMDRMPVDGAAVPAGPPVEDPSTPFRLSQEARSLNRSLMRRLIAVTARPEIISFAGGLPAPELLPVEELSVCLARVLADDGPRALQYGPPLPALQEEIAAMMAGRGAGVSPEQVFITSGCQQGLQIAAHLLLDPDSAVVLDRFIFPGVRQAFGGWWRELREVPTDVTLGLDLEMLAAALTGPPRPRALVVVPAFHNPLGTTLAPAARQTVVELAGAAGVPIVEDDPYSGLQFAGPVPVPLVGLAPGQTLYLGSFSKLVAPALRLGWIIAPVALEEKLRVIKESFDLETSGLVQRAAAAFLRAGYLEPHLARVRVAYGQRLRCMTAALARHFPPGTRWSEPAGGMFLWVELPEGLDTLALLAPAIEAGVAYIPGAAFTGAGPTSAMRLNFSNATPESIETGVRILGGMLREQHSGATNRGG